MTPVALLLAGALLQAPPPSMTIIEPLFFYDSGSATPRPQNRRNFEVLVEYALRPDVRQVIILAHTDTVGSADANLALARARGQVIADRLVAEGVPHGIIRIDALGETLLPRPTADGVAEPLNRQVWVDIRSGVR